MKDERFIFGGLANIQAEINDLFLMENLELSGSIPDLTINKDSWGKVTYSFKTPNLKDEVVGYVTVAKDDFKLKVNSTFTPKNKQNILEDHQIFVQAKVEKFPFKFFDYFLGDNVKDSEGTISGDINLKGGLKNPIMKVIAIPSNVATTVSYLNARYSLTDNTVNIDNKMFDFSKCKLIDELGNTATIRGGFTHDFFKKFRLDIDVNSDNFLLLNTTRDNNPDYFGKGIGKADVSFKGSFLTPTIDIKAATNKGTIFNIPLDNSDFTKSSLDFLTFTNFSDTTTTEKKTLSGVNLNMDIQVTNDALMRILFDEQQGDIIQSKGSGNVKLNYTIVGDMNVFGTYQIDKGDYLFTYQNLVNKPFDILPGGTITWNGNPYKAQLNIKAQYSQKSPVTNFIYEYLSSEENNLVNEAGNATSVDLIMNITGLLDQPIINFDFQFPQITGPIKSYVETKLRSLRNDQNELNRQVFALVVLGTFLPSNDLGGTFGSGNQILSNTLNELISNQISMYLSDIISEAFEDVKFIDDLRFNLDYRTYDNSESLDVDDFNTNNQVGVGIQNTLLNNKLLISIGGNFDVGRSNGVQNNTGSYVAGDFLIEYRITSDGRFRLKAYQTTQSAIEGRRSKTGVGISYRNEFDTFADFVNNLKKSGNKKTK